MPRLSRAESQARTREQLVGVARVLFLRDGYAATSLERVADEAGYSKGAVYSNFQNKNELCLAVLDQIHADRVAEMAGELLATESLDELLAAFEAWAERRIGDQAWTALEVEFASNVRNDSRLRDELAMRDKAIRELIASQLRLHTERFGVSLPMSADACATALLSLGIGLGVQRAIDPSIPLDVFTEVIRLLTEPSRSRPQPG